MDEFIDAIVDELKREAEKHPVRERVLKIYDFQKMIDVRIGRVMDKFMQQELREGRTPPPAKGGG